jgi:hypothetical protein
MLSESRIDHFWREQGTLRMCPRVSRQSKEERNENFEHIAARSNREIF